jgi:hypothetical protein
MFGEPEAKRQLVRTVRGAGRKWDGEKDREISTRGFFCGCELDGRVLDTPLSKLSIHLVSGARYAGRESLIASAALTTQSRRSHMTVECEMIRRTGALNISHTC